jgi:hypothetical protein
MWNLLREIANARSGKLTDSIAGAGTDLTNSDTESGATWMAQMDEAAASHNMSIQFCMMNPCHALQSTLMKQMTNGRATWDNHREYNGVFTMGQNGLLYWCGTTFGLSTNLVLAPLMRENHYLPRQDRLGTNVKEIETKRRVFRRSLGFFASRDNVFSSADTVNQSACVEGGAACFQHNAALNNAVAVLSGGPYGISDKVGMTDKTTVMRACRSDGVMLRPSWPLSSLDVSFTKHNGALIWSAHDEHAGGEYRWQTVLGVNLATNVSLSIEELRQGHVSPATAAVAWKMQAHGDSAGQGIWPGRTAARTGAAAAAEAGAGVGAGRVVTVRALDAHNPLMLEACPLPKDPLAAPDPGSVHWNVAPVLPGGLVLLGDMSKWAPMSTRRVAAVTVADTGTTTAQIIGAPGEVVTIAYADHAAVVADAMALGPEQLWTAACAFPSGAGAKECDTGAHGGTDCALTLTCRGVTCSCG